MGEYTIEQGRAGLERMDVLAAVHEEPTVALLDRVGVSPGARCVDFGCGAGHVAMELARRTGADGAVVGVDLDAQLLEVARERSNQQDLGNVSFEAVDFDLFAGRGFDLCYSRLLLIHLPDPSQALRTMARCLRPGGTMVIEDADFSGCFTDPFCEAFDTWVAWYRETVRRRGGDLTL